MPDPAASPRDAEARGGGSLHISPVPAVAAGILWSILCFGHGFGLDVVTLFFEWARTPDALHPEGGQSGFARGEMLLILLFGGGALTLFSALVWRLRSAPIRALASEAVPWVLWAALAHLVWKTVILYSSELVHFAQYALIACLVNWAVDRGRRPQLAFVVAVSLGFADEIWQHYGLHVWLMGESTHWMDWSDPILDALGACAGILPFVTLRRLRGEALPNGHRYVRRAVAAGAVLLLPLLLLDPVTTSSVLGSYPYDSFWVEHVNDKPVHWLKPHEGIPLCLAAVLILGTLLDGTQQRGLSQRSMAVLALLLLLTVRPVSRRDGRPVHEVVATTLVPRAAPVAADGRASPAVVIDGSLDEPAWASAPRLGPFVLNSDGRPTLSCTRGQSPSDEPIHPTYARLLWDDEALYIAFEVDDGDIWTIDRPGDDAAIVYDEGVKVCLDIGGDELTYHQFHLNPLNRVRDLFTLIPAAPLDYNPWSRAIGISAWDAQGLRSAVRVRGTADEIEGWDRAPDRDEDDGYTVEIALPWQAFRTTTTPGGDAIRQTDGPRAGDRWRLGLYRVERPRPALRPGEGDHTVSAAEARRYFGATEERFADMLRWGKLKPLSETGDEFLFDHLNREAAQQCAEFQAWSPTYSDPYRPSRFGVIEFGE